MLNLKSAFCLMTLFLSLLGCNSKTQVKDTQEIEKHDVRTPSSALPLIPETRIIDNETIFTIDESNRAGWWKPITSNDDTLFVAFNSLGAESSRCEDNSTHHITVAYKSEQQSWQYLNAQTSKYLWNKCDNNGHKQPSIAVDGNNVIHLWADMHNNKDGCCYFNNLDSNDKLALKNDFEGKGKFTYPIADTSPSGDIYLVLRNLPNINPGDESVNYEGAGELYLWKHKLKKWRKVSTFAENTQRLQGFNAPVYPDDVYVDSQGIVHILWQWSLKTTGAKRYYGSYITYHESDRSFYAADGTLLSTPISLASRHTIPSLVYEDSIPYSGTFIQTAKLIVDDKYCSPCIAYRTITESQHQVRFTRWVDGHWSEPEIAFSTSSSLTSATLDISVDQTAVAIFYAVKDEGAFVARRELNGLNWTSQLVQPSSAQDIRLSVTNYADKIILYLSNLVNEDQRSELSIKPIK
ncbi:BNR-4 repeat-containing protein [Pseudoalteromonas apostichopi]|uniref:BNR-4 repeat-containing protein n=1 Tax=Pseudoalteromonas apostichopi TaxID=3035452 RepID=UPI0025748843|nr:BNR-4 repeat-containing protein [Pseudoalteromonas sp. FE4]